MFIEIPASKLSIAKRKPVHEIGINDAIYMTQIIINGKKVKCPYYNRWKSMIQRCYSSKCQESNPTYIGCTVCDEWLLFSNFKRWMISQDWKGKELDKDVLKPGNKIYSQKSCVFIPKALNSLLNDYKSGRGHYPRGVCFCNQTGKYQAHVSIKSKMKKLGRFSTVNAASLAYIKAKTILILQAALEQADCRIANGLRLHAEILKHNS